MSANAVALNLTFPYNGKNDVLINLNGFNLTITQDVNFGIFQGTASGQGKAHTLQIGTGILTCRNINMPLSGHKKFSNVITITSGTLKCNNITMGSGSDGDDKNIITMTGAGTFDVSGIITGGTSGSATDGVINLGTLATYGFSGTSGTQIIPAGTYCNVLISGSGTKQLAGNITINPYCKLKWAGSSVIDNNGFSLTYSANSYLVYEDISNGYKFSTGNEWPITNAPPKVTINLTGTSSPRVTISADKTIPDTLNLIAGNLALNNRTLNLNGIILGSGKLVANGTSSNLVIGGAGAFGSISFNQDTTGTTNRLNNLTFNRTTSGTLSLGDTLQVVGVITATDGTLTTSGRLIFAATSPTIYGQMAGVGTGTISGNVRVEKVLEDVVAGWRHFSLPAQNTVNNITGLQVRTTSNPANQQSIYYWDTTRNGTTQFAKGWTAGTTSNDQSRSYSIYNNNANTGVHELSSKIYMEGNLTQADYTINLHNFADALNPTGGSTAYGWNLIPNRFASNIDVGALIRNSNFMPAYKAVHVWDRAANQYVGINQSTLINYNTPSNIDTINNIAPWQAFWVKADSSGQSIDMIRAFQTASMSNVQQFMKSAPDFMRLNVKDNNGFMDQIAVMFAMDATEDFDGDKDMYKLKSLSGEVPSLFIVENQTEQCATALPYTKKRTVALSFESYTNAQSYTFSPEFDNFAFDGEVILEDLKTGKLTDLRTNTYQFTHDNSFVAQRFLLHFNAKVNTSSVNTNLNQERTYVYGGNEGIVIHYSNIANGTDGSVTIYNALGQQVYQNNVASGQTINFQPAAPTQVYMVTIVTNGIAKTHKLLY